MEELLCLNTENRVSWLGESGQRNMRSTVESVQCAFLLY